MDDWSEFNQDNSYPYNEENLEHLRPHCTRVPAEKPFPSSSSLTLLSSPATNPTCELEKNVLKGETPRELRNKAEKQRRHELNKCISHLATIVPPVAFQARKLDRTSILRLTAHYLRSHQHVFGNSVNKSSKEFSLEFTRTLLNTLGGFLITTTYKGILVVASPNIHEYLGYKELDLLGKNIYNYVHENDRALLNDQLTPPIFMFGPNGELLVSDDAEDMKKIAEALTKQKRSFIIRFKKINRENSGSTKPTEYLTCHVEGTFRKADKAGPRYLQSNRRGRCGRREQSSSGNDVVFVGVARPVSEAFISKGLLESMKMEYRTRHGVDGQILECDQRIALVTGYMTHEVSGLNAMKFMHRDDVRLVILALREMYDENRVYGESCYRLMTRNGEFIYMRTCGRMDIDIRTNSITSFVCTNTLVDEEQGKQLIELMKKRYMLIIAEGKNNDGLETLEVFDERFFEPLPGPSGMCGNKRPDYIAEDVEPQTHILINHDDFSDDNMLDSIRLNPTDHSGGQYWDLDGVDYDGILEEARRDRSSYFNNLNA